MGNILIEDIDKLLNIHFPGKVVRKDLTKLIKEGANVPTYVLEYLLGMYCATDDEETIEDGLKRVKSILSDNFVRPDEAEKIKAKIRESGIYNIIDKVTVKLNEKKDIYEAEFSNLGIKNVEINDSYIKNYDRLLGGGIWCIVQLEYYFDENAKGVSPFKIRDLRPIQIASLDINEIFEGRKHFNMEQWMDNLL